MQMKLSYFSLCSALLISLISISFPANTSTINQASGEAPFSYTLTSVLGESGAVITRANQYDYAPSVVKVNSSSVYMWWCGGGGSGVQGGDSIFFSSSTNYGQTWSTPVEVIRPSINHSYLDYGHTCDPSVTWYGSHYYITYGGTPDWSPNGGGCDSGGPTGCDTRIFVARVPDNQVSTASAYQKLTNVGECITSGCFQWKPFWSGLEYPPVPIIRNEISSVWRRQGTGNTGYTTQQTRNYGIGQPSGLAVGTQGYLRIWHTRILSTSQVHVWQRSGVDITNAYQLQRHEGWTKQTSNTSNHVNYDLAFNSTRNRYFCTVAIESVGEKPRVHAAHISGDSLWSGHIVSNNLNTQGQLSYAEGNAHNSGFLRDKWGYLVTMAGHSGGNNYFWVYYGNNRNQSPSNWNINRIPFTLSP